MPAFGTLRRYVLSLSRSSPARSRVPRKALRSFLCLSLTFLSFLPPLDLPPFRNSSSIHGGITTCRIDPFNRPSLLPLRGFILFSCGFHSPFYVLSPTSSSTPLRLFDRRFVNIFRRLSFPFLSSSCETTRDVCDCGEKRRFFLTASNGGDPLCPFPLPSPGAHANG